MALFLDIMELVEEQTIYDSKVQQIIDKLSASYFYVSCDIESYNIGKAISALEQKKYRLHQETQGYSLVIISSYQSISHIVFQYLG